MSELIVMSDRGEESNMDLGPLESALQKISFKDFRGAFSILEKMNERTPKNPLILYHMGTCQVQLRMLREAEESFLLSNTPQSLFSCFELYLREQRLEEALQVLKRSQSIDALLELIRIQNDESHPLHQYRDSINLGKTKCLLGTRYLLGEDGLSVNEERALQLYRESSMLDYCSGYTGLAYMYEHGLGGLAPNMEEAVKLYRKGAEKGCVRAMGNLGNCCLEGLGIPVNEEEALKWLSMAAKEGDTDSMTILGMYYAKKQQEESAKESMPEPVMRHLEGDSSSPPQVIYQTPEKNVTITSSPHRRSTSPLSNLSSRHSSPKSFASPESLAPSTIPSSPLSPATGALEDPDRIEDLKDVQVSPKSAGDDLAELVDNLESVSPIPVNRALQRRSVYESIYEDSDADQRGSIDLRQLVELRAQEELESSPLRSKSETLEDIEHYDDIINTHSKEAPTEAPVNKSIPLPLPRLDEVSLQIRNQALHDPDLQTSTIYNNESFFYNKTTAIAIVLIPNTIVFSINSLGQVFSFLSVVSAVLLYTLYLKDYRFIYCMGAVVLSFFLHLISLIGSAVTYCLLRSKAGRYLSLVNFVISFGSLIASASFAVGIAIILTIFHLNGVISLTTWA